ncbi:MAG: hypothetical protein J1G04_02855 [Clostridiales bacterium]|nr:hypothetical protein [Clostridiales bacterium]
MSIWKGIVELIVSANILTMSLWVTGIVLFAAEFFQPMHKLGYTLGLLLVVAAFVTHTLHGTVAQAFWFVFLTVIVIYVVHIVSVVICKRDWLNASRIGRARERSRKFGTLAAGSVGIAISPINLTGSATINDINLVVYSETPISAGERVRITRVTRDRIIVERA